MFKLNPFTGEFDQVGGILVEALPTNFLANSVIFSDGSNLVEDNANFSYISPRLTVGAINITGGDSFIEDTHGLVIGHTAQIDFGAIPEFQVLGTGTPDSSMGFARFENNASGPDVRFLKSRGATIGANTIVNDGDTLGRIRFQGADGNDFNTTAAQMLVKVDGAASLNNIFGKFIWETRSSGGGLAEKMSLDKDGALVLAGTGRFDDGIVDSSSVIIVDTQSRHLKDDSNTIVLTFTSESLVLRDNSGFLSHNWGSRELRANDGLDTILNYSTVGIANFNNSIITTSGIIKTSGNAEFTGDVFVGSITDLNAFLNLNVIDADDIGLGIKMASMATGDAINILDSGSAELFVVEADGDTIISGTLTLETTLIKEIVAAKSLEIGTEAELGLWPVVDGFAFFGNSALDHSVAGNFALLQSSTGTTFINSASGRDLNFRIANSTKATLDFTGRFGFNNTSPVAQVDILSNATTVVGLIVKEISSQTADIAQFLTSNGVGMTIESGASVANGDIIIDGNGDLDIGTAAQLRLGGGGTDAVTIGRSTANTRIVGDLEIDKDLNHDGTVIGFFGTTPAVQVSAYTPINVSADRAYDANATTVDELADILGTLIADLQTYGLLQ